MTAQGPMARAVTDALKDAQVPARDLAAVRLAKEYARILDGVRGTEDESEVFDKIGARLLATLTSLGMTAAGRGVKGGTTHVSTGSSPLDELRARRAGRASGA